MWTRRCVWHGNTFTKLIFMMKQMTPFRHNKLYCLWQSQQNRKNSNYENNDNDELLYNYLHIHACNYIHIHINKIHAYYMYVYTYMYNVHVYLHVCMYVMHLTSTKHSGCHCKTVNIQMVWQCGFRLLSLWLIIISTKI